MAFKNFKLETDADGIALVTWDIPGRSMNVLDTQTIEELGAIVDQTTADAAVKGVVDHVGQGRFLRRRRSLHAGGHEQDVCRGAEVERQGSRAANAVR